MAVWFPKLDPRPDCRICTQEQQEFFGCITDAPHPIFIVKGVLLKRCPIQLINRQSVRYLEAYKFFQKGKYPNPGEWPKQPAKFLKAMEIIESELAEIDEQERKELERNKP